ncbi:MAG TPA: DUF1269 domain-containing protein [Myxococcaceae bacterium]|nr:DUF1269 domain-containing protein [Myxococcaceae bacterium]
MNRMLVVVFDDEKRAYEGKNALRELDAEGSVFVYASAVVTKGADGTVAVKQEEPGPVGSLLGTGLGALIGLLGGPTGAAIGAASGFTVGMAGDIDQTRVGADFIDDVRKALPPGKAAVLAEVDEDWTAPVDTRMEKLGGIVFRRALSEVRDVANDEDTAAIKADIAESKAEHAQASAERKAKLLDRINKLDSKLQARLEKANERREAAKRAAQAKAARLSAKAAVARARAP